MGLGTNVVDRVALVDRLAAADQKIPVRATETHPGGAVCNNLAQACRLGASVAWVGFLGADPEGRFLQRDMRAVGIDARHARTLKGRRTPVSWIAVGPDGERAIYMFPAVNRDLTASHVARHFGGAIRGAVHFHTEIAQVRLVAVIAAMKLARAAGARVFLDLDIPTADAVGMAELGSEAELDLAISLAHVLKPCRAAALQLTRRRDVESAVLELLKRGPEIVAVTAGADGAVLARRGEIVKAPALPMVVKDTTGAGDAFLGGLSFALLCGESLARAGAIANACAAFTVARVGSRSQPGYDDVRALLRTMTAFSLTEGP